jgi:very-short-patch-repair endonuclease
MNEETPEKLLTWEECRQQIIELGKFELDTNGKFITSYRGYMGIYISKKKSLLKMSIDYLTSHFPKDLSNRERIHHILYDKREYIDPKCKTCGKKPRMGTASEGYVNHCSKSCATSDKEIIEKNINTKLRRYGKKSTTNAEKTRQTKLERYGDGKYNNTKKGKQTYFEKTGFETPFNNPGIHELCKKTKFEKYGNEFYSNREKADETFIRKYGSRSYRNHKKRTETIISKYGSIYNSQEKLRNTNLQRYGVEYVLQSAQKRELADDTRETLYGDKNYRNHEKRADTLTATMGENWHSIIFKSYSKVSQELFWEIYNHLPEELKEHTHFGELNSEYRVMYNKEKRRNYFYDFCITSLKLIIEFDGAYWHSLKGAKERDAHKQKIIEDLGFKVIRVNELDYYEDKEKLIDYCVDKVFEVVEGELA